MKEEKKDKGGYAYRCGWDTLPKAGFSSFVLECGRLGVRKLTFFKEVYACRVITPTCHFKCITPYAMSLIKIFCLHAHNKHAGNQCVIHI